MLIGIALPHREVEIADFHKHISADDPEPRRMKQLLTWCATRALSDRPTSGEGDVTAILAGKIAGGIAFEHILTRAGTARAIQEELLKDFANKSELSDWFSRVS